MGGEIQEKIQQSQMLSQNLSIYQILSESDNGEVYRTVKGWWESRGKVRGRDGIHKTGIKMYPKQTMKTY